MSSDIIKSVYKVCTNCFKTFPTRDEYVRLTKYLFTFKTGKYRTFDLEFRNCSCGTTLATECEKV